MESFRCPVCGCTSRHYSSARNSYVCDRCGSMAETQSEINARISFANSLARARDLVRAGDYRKALAVLAPLGEQQPANSEVFSLELNALTEGYKRYFLYGYERVIKAKKCWDRLASLSALTPEMKYYGEKRLSFMEQRLKKEKSTRGWTCYAGIMCAGLGILAPWIWVKIIALAASIMLLAYGGVDLGRFSKEAEGLRGYHGNPFSKGW